MKTLNSQELRTFEQIFQLKQPSLMKAMRQYLKSKYDNIIATNEYLIAVGDSPVALMAHLDTVFDKPPQNIYYDRVKNIMFSPDGLGADDRAGVYAIIQIIRSGLRPTIIFTTDEELGCKGAAKLAQDIPTPPTALKYIIELDRRGSDDCVFYQCDNFEFEVYVENFGFVMNFGSFSDISAICPKWGVAGVNLSIGYYHEHSYSEILNVGQMFNTINKVKKMIEASAEAPAFAYVEAIPSAAIGAGFGTESLEWDPSYGISREDWEMFMSPQSKCKCCGNYDFDYNMFPTKSAERGLTEFYCAECISQKQDIHWCFLCGEPFVNASIPKGTNPVYCKDCEEKIKND